MVSYIRSTRTEDRTPAPGAGEQTSSHQNHPRERLARLATLHREAAETAMLANLLGRTPWIAASLTIMAVVTVLGSHPAAAPAATWLLLLAAGAVALLRAWRAGLAAPFEHKALMTFSRDLGAIVLYIGCAWGAGGFLFLAGHAGLLAILLFAAGTVTVMAVCLRVPDHAAAFGVPAILLVAAAVLAARGLPDAGVIMACGFGIALAVYGADRLSRRLRERHLSDLAWG